MRILVVEDDSKIASFVVKGLRQHGFAVDHAPDGDEGLSLIRTVTYDAAILDLGQERAHVRAVMPADNADGFHPFFLSLRPPDGKAVPGGSNLLPPSPPSAGDCRVALWAPRNDDAREGCSTVY